MLRLCKKPLRYALFDRDNASAVWQESRALTYGPSTGQTLKRSETEAFYGGGRQTGCFSHRDTAIVDVGAAGVKAATALLRRFGDQRLTLTDAVGLQLMKTRRIQTCWSTDRHLGLTGVPLVIG